MRIAVLGLGVVGTLVAKLLQKAEFDIIGFDATEQKQTFPTRVLDVSKQDKLQTELSHVDGVVSCLPFFLNGAVAKVAKRNNIHYFDLTEDVETTQEIQELAKGGDKIFMPQCGLAPGFIGILTNALYVELNNKIKEIRMRVGALPAHGKGALKYAFNWSPEGVINEYIKPCDAIRNGEVVTLPSLSEREELVIDGICLEAFLTSGGLGILPELWADKVERLDYKSMRYPGHQQVMLFLLKELAFADNIKEITKRLKMAYPPQAEDRVFIYASAQDVDGRAKQVACVFRPQEIDGHVYKAIAWTTAASVVAIVEMLRDGKLAKQGFVGSHDIDLADFLQTKSGQLYSLGGFSFP